MSTFFENAFSHIGNTLQKVADDHGDSANASTAQPNAFGKLGSIGSMVGQFRSGKPVELGRFSEAGFSGRIVAIADGSEAAKHLDTIIAPEVETAPAAATPVVQ